VKDIDAVWFGCGVEIVSCGTGIDDGGGMGLRDLGWD
jgi:hypothetical protein